MSTEILQLVRDSARALRRAFEVRARELGVTQDQAAALAVLAGSEGMNQSRLAERTDMDPIALCRMVDRLEAAGLVRRERDPADRRARRVYLTGPGWTRLRQLRELARALADRAGAGIDGAEIDVARAVLERMIANLATDSDAALDG